MSGYQQEEDVQKLLLYPVGNQEIKEIIKTASLQNRLSHSKKQTQYTAKLPVQSF